MLTKILRYFGITILVSFCFYAVHINFLFNYRDTKAIEDSADSSTYRLRQLISFFEDRFYDYRMNLNIKKVTDEVLKPSIDATNELIEKYNQKVKEAKNADQVKAAQIELEKLKKEQITPFEDELLEKYYVSKHQILATIDDESIEAIGRFPWSRSFWAKFIDRMNELGAKVLSFDVVFAQEQNYCPGQPSPDKELAQAIARFQKDHDGDEQPDRRVLLSYGLTPYQDEGPANLPEILYYNIIDSEIDPLLKFDVDFINQANFPNSILANDTINPGVGFIEAREDLDGIIRQYPVLANIADVATFDPQNRYKETMPFPSLGLSAYIHYTGERPKLITSPDNLYLKVNKGNLNIDQYGQTQVRWFGDIEKFIEIKIKDIMDEKADVNELKRKIEGKIVYVGSNAFGAHDLRHTPVNAMMPGVYFHMNFTEMLLENYYFKVRGDSLKLSWIILLSSTLAIFIFMLFGNAIIDLVAVTFIAGGLFYYDTYYLTPEGYKITLFFVLLSVVSVYSWNTFINFYLSTKEKKQIKGTFSRYVAPSIVDQMLSNPDKLKVGGEKKNITVFFSDVRDFTSISEALSPTQLSVCLNQYMGVMTDLLFESNGTLDKYIGDAIVAYWGAPLDVENHAYHAVKTALKMIEVLPQVNEKFKEQGFPKFEHGIGLNTGECSVGNMGSDKIFAYTALGDNMNLGARLESLCKFYGVQLNISSYTLEAIPEDLRKELKYRIIDKVRVKGKTLPVTMYEVYHSFHHLMTNPEDHQKYLQGFEAYQTQHFEEAIALLSEIDQKYAGVEKVSKIVIDRCKKYLIDPPGQDWDGVYTHTTKG